MTENQNSDPIKRYFSQKVPYWGVILTFLILIPLMIYVAGIDPRIPDIVSRTGINLVIIFLCFLIIAKLMTLVFNAIWNEKVTAVWIILLAILSFAVAIKAVYEAWITIQAL